MLDVELAERIIDKLVGCTDYNINIMNEKGIIVASKDKSRIGTFHEVAFEIVSKGLDYKEVEAEDTFLGVKPGINMALEYKKKIIGVLGLTGNCESGEIHAVAAVIKKMLETMLEYEAQKEEKIKRKTDKERFINCLLYEETNRRELASMAQALGYSEVSRIPILIFKSYGDTLEGFFENYKYVIGEYLGLFLRHVTESDISCRIRVGSLQSNMANYKFGYQHCQWLDGFVILPLRKKRSLFFYDHLDEYMKHQLPFLELHKVFDVFAKQYAD